MGKRRKNRSTRDVPELPAWYADVHKEEFAGREIYDFLNRDLPGHWVSVDESIDGGAWQHRVAPLQVIATIELAPDRSRWLHVSVIHRERIPTYGELAKVKREFIGDGRGAIMVFPPQSEHVNIHPNCLHLYRPLSEWPLPDFTHGLESI